MSKFVTRHFVVMFNSLDCELDSVEVKPEADESNSRAAIRAIVEADWTLEPGDRIEIVEREVER